MEQVLRVGLIDGIAVNDHADSFEPPLLWLSYPHQNVIDYPNPSHIEI